MQQIGRGQRLKLAEFVEGGSEMEILLNFDAEAAFDFACFGVDGGGKLVEERYMVFFNQLTSPCGGIAAKVDGRQAVFTLNLKRLPEKVQRLVFTATVDGAGVMREIRSATTRVKQGDVRAEFSMPGRELADEKALMLAELYRKDGEWRLSALGQGFNGGLAALLKHFGGEVQEEASPAPRAAAERAPVNLQKGVRLEKELEAKQPKLVSLAKAAGVSLEKKGLSEHVAKVCLVLDVSASMRSLFRRGVVQQLVDRLLALACWLDDDRSVDAFLFDSRAIDAGPITLENSSGRAQAIVDKYRLGGGTDYAPVIQMVRKFYGYGGERTEPVSPAKLPVYVLFVTDGGCSDRRESELAVRAAAYEPIFWQFVGVGGERFAFLEKLDDLKNRYIDNADFADISDPSSLSDREMYERLMQEYPDWVRKAKRQGLLLG